MNFMVVEIGNGWILNISKYGRSELKEPYIQGYGKEDFYFAGLNQLIDFVKDQLREKE